MQLTCQLLRSRNVTRLEASSSRRDHILTTGLHFTQTRDLSRLQTAVMRCDNEQRLILQLFEVDLSHVSV